MGNSQFQVPQHVANQWTEVYRNNKKYLKNKITLEQFEFMVLQKLEESQDILLLIERSIYSIPKTPKVIILNDQKRNLFILVQAWEQSLAQYLPKLLLNVDTLELLREIFTVFKFLIKKYGPFGITEGMIGLNKNSEIFAWINQHKQKNQIQIPIQNNENAERLMIYQIIAIFKKYARAFFCWEEYYGYKSFESILTQLNKVIQKKKLEIAAYQTEPRHKGQGFRRALSPHTSFGSVRKIQLKSPKAIEGGTKISKRINIPNFLKQISDKKRSFFDGLHGKRNIMIDQTDKQLLSKQKRISDLRGQKREQCSSKSLKKLKILKSKPVKDRNSNFSGQISKISFPTSTCTEKTFDLLSQSGSSGSYLLKKRQFQGPKTQKVTKNWNIQSFNLKNDKSNFQTSPAQTENKSKHWQIKRQSCLFPPPQYSQSQRNVPIFLGKKLKVPFLTICSNTSVSNYLNESKQKEPIIEQQSHSISKTLQQEFNDFFSDQPKSPRFTLQALPQSNQLTEQFNKIIDF